MTDVRLIDYTIKNCTKHPSICLLQCYCLKPVIAEHVKVAGIVM